MLNRLHQDPDTWKYRYFLHFRKTLSVKFRLMPGDIFSRRGGVLQQRITTTLCSSEVRGWYVHTRKLMVYAHDLRECIRSNEKVSNMYWVLQEICFQSFRKDDKQNCFKSLLFSTWRLMVFTKTQGRTMCYTQDGQNKIFYILNTELTIVLHKI